MSDSPEKTKEQRDKEFDLEMADFIWRRIKGVPIPDCYSEKDRLEIFARYWTRAMDREDYYFDDPLHPSNQNNNDN